MLLAQAVSKQDKKSETQSAKAQQPKNSEPNGKASNKQQQRNLSNQTDSAKNITTLSRPETGSIVTPGQSPYVSDVSDVSKSLRGSKGESKETGKQQAPEVKSKSEEAKQGADQHKAPAAAEQPSVAAGPAAEKERAPTKQVEKGPAKEKTSDAARLTGEKGSGSQKTGGTTEKGATKGEKSPKTPEEDPAFQAVVKKAKGVAKQQGHHEPAKAKAAQAQAAAKGPPNEVASQAKGAQIEKIDAQEPGHFDKESFKAALVAKIASIAPKNLEEADDFKKDNKAASIKDSVTSEVKQGKEGAQGAIKQTTAQPPDPSSAKPKEVAELKPVETGPAPPKIGAQLAAPKPKTESEISLKEGSQRLDTQMQEADVSEEQLASSNEPQFQDALKSKKDAQQHAAEAPAVYRQEEQAILAASQAEASSLGQAQIHSMHQSRQSAFKKVATHQTSSKNADEQKRAEVSAKIESIYNSTKQQVEARLLKLDEEVNKVFDSGLEQATREFEDYVDRRMSAYKDDRYGGRFGGLKWAKDKLFGMPDEVNEFYEEGRKRYIDKMDAVIDSVATIVETRLNQAKEMISAGRQEVKTYVESLPKDLKDVGKQAEENIESKFDELKQSLDEKQNQLIDSLSQKYVDNLNKVDERINEMKAENRGLVDKAKDAIVGAIKTILKLKDMLLGVLAKVASVVTKIIKHPINFLGNLVKGVKAGLSNFMGKIGDYLEQGMFEWLFGEMTKTGIQMPKAFDFKGILSLVMQALGLTYPAIRGRAVKLLGEGVVKGLEGASEIFITLVSEGPAGLWKYIQEKIADLKETVIEGIKGFLKEKIIIAGITWIVGLLNPASAFIKAAKAIYDIVMFFVTRGSQIMSLVDSIIDSMGAIADGSFGVAAAAVEKALGKAVPVVIGFLASLLGLGGIGEKIRSIIQKVQAPVTKAVDWVIQKAAGMAKSAGKLIKGAVAPKDKKDEGNPEERLKNAIAAIKPDAEAMLRKGTKGVIFKAKLLAWKMKYRLSSLEVKDGELVATINPSASVTKVVEMEADKIRAETHAAAIEVSTMPEIQRAAEDIVKQKKGGRGTPEKPILVSPEGGLLGAAAAQQRGLATSPFQIISYQMPSEDTPVITRSTYSPSPSHTIVGLRGTKGHVGKYEDYPEQLKKRGLSDADVRVGVEQLIANKPLPPNLVPHKEFLMHMAFLLGSTEVARIPSQAAALPMAVQQSPKTGLPQSTPAHPRGAVAANKQADISAGVPGATAPSKAADPAAVQEVIRVQLERTKEFIASHILSGGISFSSKDALANFIKNDLRALIKENILRGFGLKR